MSQYNGTVDHYETTLFNHRYNDCLSMLIIRFYVVQRIIRSFSPAFKRKYLALSRLEVI